MKINRGIVTAVIVVVTLCWGVCAYAVKAQESQTDTDQQSQTETTEDSNATSHELPAGTVNCFDYYHFQSVQVNVGTDKDNYIPQEDVVFTGTLENQNAYPIVDGLVFMRIGKKNPNYTQEGQFTVDEIIPMENISLAPEEKQPFQFQWNIPQDLPQGDYRADFFFSVGKKFNLGGLPFTNEVVISLADFTVDSPTTAYVSFDKSGTTVNGEKYNHIGNWPLIEPNKSAEIVQPIKNTFPQEQKTEITYDLYFWDSLNESGKIDSKKETITIPANSSIDLKYTVPQMNDSVYLLKITAVSPTQKSIANIRLTSDQIHPRLNFPAITKFPLKQGDQETIFSCFHNSATQDAKGKVTVTLTDKNSNQVGQMTYDGTITGAMMAAKNDFTANKDYNWLKLTAVLGDENGKTIEKYETVYDCEKIDSDECKAISEKTVQPKAEEENNNPTYQKTNTIIIFILIILFLLSLIFIIIKKRKSNISVWIILFLVGSLFFFGNASRVDAYNDKSVTVGDSYQVNGLIKIHYRAHTGKHFVTKNKNIAFDLLGNASITHIVKMTAGGYSVNIGSAINFSYAPDNPYFYSTGYIYDSPYGGWASSLDSGCSGGGTWLYGGYGVYTNVNAIKPSVYMTSSNSGVVSCSSMNCTAKKAGTATLTAVIPKVNGIACGKNYVSDYSPDYLSFPSASLSWTITVINNNYALNVNKSGSGSGMVTSSPSGINCGSTCSANFAANSTVTLTAVASSGSTFTSWTNCTPVSGSPTKCTVSMSAAKTVTATFTQSAPTLSFYADSSTIDYGSSTTLRWSSSNTSYCYIWGGIYGTWTNTSGAAGTGTLYSTTGYGMTCYNSAWTGSVTKYVTVSVRPAPTLSFYADSSTIDYGSSTTLRWSSSNTSYCYIWGGIYGTWTNTSGAAGTGTLYSTTGYGMTCYNSAWTGSVTKYVAVTVLPPPTLSFTADSTTVDYGESTTLRWTSANASYCYLWGGPYGSSTSSGLWTTTSGNRGTDSLSDSTTYYMVCYNSSYSAYAAKSVSITVKSPPTLTVSTGSCGKVTISPNNGYPVSECTSSYCSYTYKKGTSVTLSASAITGSFSNWSYSCSGSTNPTCNITMDSNKTASASFNCISSCTDDCGDCSGLCSGQNCYDSCGTKICSGTKNCKWMEAAP